jgi:hypothetical protein
MVQALVSMRGASCLNFSRQRTGDSGPAQRLWVHADYGAKAWELAKI